MFAETMLTLSEKRWNYFLHSYSVASASSLFRPRRIILAVFDGVFFGTLMSGLHLLFALNTLFARPLKAFSITHDEGTLHLPRTLLGSQQDGCDSERPAPSNG